MSEPIEKLKKLVVRTDMDGRRVLCRLVTDRQGNVWSESVREYSLNGDVVTGPPTLRKGKRRWHSIHTHARRSRQ